MSQATSHVEDRLLDFAYGELSAQDARDVESHLAGCAECKAQLDDIQGVRKVMSHLPEAAAPSAGLDSLLAYAEQAARRAAAGPPPKPAWWRKWILPVAGVATAAIAFFVVNDAFEGRSSLKAEVARAAAEAQPAPPPATGALPRPQEVQQEAALAPAQPKASPTNAKGGERAKEDARELAGVIATEPLEERSPAEKSLRDPGAGLGGLSSTSGGGGLGSRGLSSGSGVVGGSVGGMAAAGPTGAAGRGAGDVGGTRDADEGDGARKDAPESKKRKAAYAEVAAPAMEAEAPAKAEEDANDRAMFATAPAAPATAPVVTAAPAPAMRPPSEPPAPPARAEVARREELRAAKPTARSRAADKPADDAYALDDVAHSQAESAVADAKPAKESEPSAAEMTRLLDQADAAARSGNHGQAAALAETALAQSTDARIEQRALRILCETHPDFEQAQLRCEQLIAKYPKSGAAQVARKRMAAPADADSNAEAAAKTKQASPSGGAPATRPSKASESAAPTSAE